MDKEAQKAYFSVFLLSVDKDGDIKREGLTPCWKWLKSKSTGGYGQFDYKKIKWNAHRYSWWYHNECPDLEELKGKQIMHQCDNPECCNPEHLTLGTPKDNAIDALTRIKKKVYSPKLEKEKDISFSRKGENNGRAKLTMEQVNQIRQKRDTGLKYGELKKLAEEYNITYITMQKIIANKLWN